MADDSIVGAWELVSDSRVAIAIFTGSHYAFVGAAKDRRPSTGDQATPDEALEALNSCPALSGTYTVSGSRITQIRVANTRPNLSVRPAIVDYTIDGDILTSTGVSGGAAAPGAVDTWRRLPDSGAGSPLVGAWELVDDARQGVLIYTGAHYAVVQMQKERNLPKGDQYTPEEALEAISTSGSLAGTYSVSGNTVSAERIANLRPTFVGVTAVHEFAVEGDTLNLRGISGIPLEETVWRKVG